MGHGCVRLAFVFDEHALNHYPNHLKHNNIDLVNVMPLKTSNQIVSKNKLSITNNKLRLHPDI